MRIPRRAVDKPKKPINWKKEIRDFAIMCLIGSMIGGIVGVGKVAFDTQATLMQFINIYDQRQGLPKTEPQKPQEPEYEVM